MKNRIGRKVLVVTLVIMFCLGVVGCATVPMATPEMDAKMKEFTLPDEGKAGLYIYRDGNFGAAIVDDISLDGTVIGRLAANTYLYRAIEPGPHELSIPTEFSKYKIDLVADAGKHSYIRYYLRMGVFRGNGAFEIVERSEAEEKILKCKLAQ